MRLRFGNFELDLDGCELTRGGRSVALERRPTEILCLLARHAGELVSRRVLAHHVWGGGNSVDADLGLNTAMRKIRVALGDVSGTPQFVETVRGRGYRFIAATQEVPVEARPVQGPAPTLAADRKSDLAAIHSLLNQHRRPALDDIDRTRLALFALPSTDGASLAEVLAGFLRNKSLLLIMAGPEDSASPF